MSYSLIFIIILIIIVYTILLKSDQYIEEVIPPVLILIAVGVVILAPLAISVMSGNPLWLSVYIIYILLVIY